VSPSVVVAGALANKAGNGGEAWVRLSWVLGLHRLGCDVHLLEQLDGGSASQHDYFDAVTAAFGLAGRATLVRGNGASGDLLELASTSDLLVNISGHLTNEDLLSSFRRKVYVDLDPGYTQLWHAAGLNGAHLAGHDVYFTVGENIGRPGCAVPTGDIDWRPVRPPIVLSKWPASRTGAPDRLTTVATWRGPYGRVEQDGKVYGLKLDEFRKLAALPGAVAQRLELALSIHPDERRDLSMLGQNGWHLVDPTDAAGTPERFRAYIQASGGEFSVAQGVYVETGSGWFSDRTAAYLASGKPALVQDTGFSRNLPTGEGLVPFRTFEEAVDGAERIASDYEAHCRASRSLAEHEFDSDVVLTGFLEAALA
jgi:hypothetical protein